MRRLSLVALLVCAGCVGNIPRPPPGMKISIRAPVRVHVQGQVQVQGQGQVAAPQPPPPPPPAVIVPIVDAPVPEFFGISLEGVQDVVFVLDVSGSMNDHAAGRLAAIPVAPPTEPTTAPPPGPPPPPPPPADPYAPPPPPEPAPVAPPAVRKIDIAQSELVDALRRLPDGTRINIMFFNSELEAVSLGLFTLDGSTREGLVTFVLDKQPDGSTALTPAMRMAFLMNARRVVLLSDGLGNVGGNDATLLRDAREAIRGGVRIDTIGLGRDQDGDLLGTLARESGGLYQPL